MRENLVSIVGSLNPNNFIYYHCTICEQSRHQNIDEKEIKMKDRNDQQQISHHRSVSQQQLLEWCLSFYLFGFNGHCMYTMCWIYFVVDMMIMRWTTLYCTVAFFYQHLPELPSHHHASSDHDNIPFRHSKQE